MKTAAVLSSKGGVGKSVLAVHIAVAAEHNGLATAIFDLDPQASSAIWSDHRGETTPAVIAAQAPRLPGLLRQALIGGADLVILDTPPSADSTAASAGGVADVILIPCRPSAFDLDAIGASIRIARVAGRPAYVVINAAPAQGVEVSETRAALESAGVNVCPIVLHQRKAYSSRAHEGQTALEHEPNGKAAAEIRSLLTWLLDVIGLPIEQADGVECAPGNVVARRPVSEVAHA